MLIFDFIGLYSKDEFSISFENTYQHFEDTYLILTFKANYLIVLLRPEGALLLSEV
jgi:hypothetical protein